MDMLINIVLLIVGFALLVKGADFFVEGSSYIAKVLKVPAVIVGLTIVSIGTSAPELAVSVAAATKGESAMSISNVIGSNMFNLLMVLGVCSVIKPVKVKESILKFEFPFSIFLTGLVLFFISDKVMPWNDAKYSKDTIGSLGRPAGIIIIVLLIGFILFLIRSALKQRNEMNEEFKKMNPILCAVYVIGGIAAIVIGGDVVVDSAKSIALALGMTETLVGLTIVAMGTSLPELVTSVVASRKGSNDIAVGNVVGSNIFNILLVLGLSATISPMLVLTISAVDLVILIVVSIIAYIFAFTKKEINRVEGIIMILMYAAYMVYAIIR
ncbi:MAG: calcium/sodium antiporter [Lachnospiraceae bacterium]|nr:calcium/sodium antiporter [Lachnospiraceae bacterium]